MEWMKRMGGAGIYRWHVADSTEEIPTESRRQRLFPQNFLGIFKIPNGSLTAIIYPRIFVGGFRGIWFPRYFIDIFRGNSEETQIFPRKFVGIFRGSHFPSECLSELRCFLVVSFFQIIFAKTQVGWLPTYQPWPRRRHRSTYNHTRRSMHTDAHQSISTTVMFIFLTCYIEYLWFISTITPTVLHWDSAI